MFHYTTEQGLDGIITSKRLWLVSSREMSDITDRFYANLFATTALLSSEDENARLLVENLTPEDILQINMDTLEVPFYSASFCEQNNNDYLWNKYAGRNKGVCIEIDECFFDTYECKVVIDNYNSLDDADTPEKEMIGKIIERRRVEYGYPIDVFLKVLNLTKNCCISENDITDPDGYTKSKFRNWLFLTLTLLSGTIKADSYEREDEVRFLFQDRYTDEYVNKNCMYSLFRCRLTEVLKALGVDREIIDNGKKRVELNIENIFNEKLIKSIIIGDDFLGDRERLKEKLKNAGLSKTVLKDRRGNLL